MQQTALALPWLLFLVASPACGALWCARVRDAREARRVASVCAALAAAIALGLTLLAFGSPPRHFFVDPLPDLGGSAPLGCDALSGPLLVLVAAVGLASFLASSSAEASPRELARALATQAAALLALCALDLRIFAAAWILGLIPLLRSLREAGARSVALRFGLIQGLGCLALLGALGLLIADERAPTLGLALSEGGLPLALCLGVAVCVRQGLFPLHSWLPTLHQRGAPTLVALCFAPQLGLYLVLRLCAAEGGALHETLAGPLLGLAAGTAVYGALLGLVQRDLRRALGWLTTSQSALIATGVLSASQSGVTGALLLWASSGLALTGLLQAAAALEGRFGTVDLDHPQGLGARTPRLAALFLLLGLASVGLPGTLGFASEDLLFHGTLEAIPAAGLALVVATALNGLSVLRISYRTFDGARRPLPAVPDLLPRERAVFLGLFLLLVGGGLLPGRLVQASARSASVLRERSAERTD